MIMYTFDTRAEAEAEVVEALADWGADYDTAKLCGMFVQQWKQYYYLAAEPFKANTRSELAARVHDYVESGYSFTDFWQAADECEL